MKSIGLLRQLDRRTGWLKPTTGLQECQRIPGKSHPTIAGDRSLQMLIRAAGLIRREIRCIAGNVTAMLDSLAFLLDRQPN